MMQTLTATAFCSSLSLLRRSVHRSVISLDHQEGRRVFWDGSKFFELRPIILIDVQYIFPGGTKHFLGGATAPLRSPWLRAWACTFACYAEEKKDNAKREFGQQNVASKDWINTFR